MRLEMVLQMVKGAKKKKAPEMTRKPIPKGVKNGQNGPVPRQACSILSKSTRNPLTVPPGTYSLHTD